MKNQEGGKYFSQHCRFMQISPFAALEVTNMTKHMMQIYIYCTPAKHDPVLYIQTK